MEPRKVPARNGWRWIVEGFALFRRSPAMWIVTLLVFFLVAKLLLRVPVVGFAFTILVPVFVAGLMAGCHALERGGRLQVGHLAAGFLHNAAGLVTIGGVWLVGNLLIMMIVMNLGGDAIQQMAKVMSQGTAMTPELAQQMQPAAQTVARSLFIGMLLSVPLVMLLWFAPLLVYFDNQRPVAAMKASFMACLKNVGAMFVYGGVIFAAMFIATPFSIALGLYDLALVLVAPVAVPSMYASYKDVFVTAQP